MSKSITVPDIGYNPIRLQINNKTYELIPGATMTVPDEVAALLSQIAGAKPQEDPDIADKQYATLWHVKALIAAAVGAALPEVTTDDNGDVLTVVSGEWAKADLPTGLPAVTGSDNGKLLGVSSGAWAAVTPSDSVFYVHVNLELVYDEDPENPEIVLTPVTSFADAKAAYLSGKHLILCANAPVPTGGPIVSKETRLQLTDALNETDPLGFIFSGVLETAGSTSHPEIEFCMFVFTTSGYEMNSVPLAAAE